MKRPDWSAVWVHFIQKVAARSTCDRLQVGCVIVSDDNSQVLALGYNGNYRNGHNACDCAMTPGNCGCIHAEENALIKLNYRENCRKVLYSTHLPCKMCSKKIINAGIAKVVFKEIYRNVEGLQLLRDNGIEVVRW